MTTKAKCIALAAEHSIEIYACKLGDGWHCDLSIPDGFTLEDYEGAMTGLTIWGVETAKEFWKSVYGDLLTCIDYKPWHKITEQ